MSYYEYLDLDRKTVTGEVTPRTLAKRYVYTGNMGEHPHLWYVGKWRPANGSKVVDGVIVHPSESDNDRSDVLARMVLARVAAQVENMRAEVSRKTRTVTDVMWSLESLLPRLRDAEARLERLRQTNSLSVLLAERAHKGIVP